jgi:hypothetical protein
MKPETLQTIQTVWPIASTAVAVLAVLVSLKISLQISRLETRIITRLADEYVTKDEMRFAISQIPTTTKKANAHA